MQLVGATEGFIRKPFVLKGLAHGALSAFFALMFLSGIIIVFTQNIPELQLITSTLKLVYLYAVVVVIGMIMSGISTLIAVKRFINIRVDKLYV